MNRSAEGTLVLAWGGVSKEQSLETVIPFFPIDLLVKTVSRRKRWSGQCIEGCVMGFRELFAAPKVGLPEWCIYFNFGSSVHFALDG